jgi:hypothetical protein
MGRPQLWCDRTPGKDPLPSSYISENIRFIAEQPVREGPWVLHISTMGRAWGIRETITETTATGEEKTITKTILKTPQNYKWEVDVAGVESLLGPLVMKGRSAEWSIITQRILERLRFTGAQPFVDAEENPARKNALVACVRAEYEQITGHPPPNLRDFRLRIERYLQAKSGRQRSPKRN